MTSVVLGKVEKQKSFKALKRFETHISLDITMEIRSQVILGKYIPSVLKFSGKT